MPCIRVRFIAQGTFVSAAIRKITGSLFSHVEFGTPEGTWIGAHLGGGIEERPADYCSPAREYVYEIPCTEEVEADALKWMRAKIGTKYNTLDILGLMLHTRSLTGPGQYICSQFVTEGLLNTFGAPRVMNTLALWTYLVTPEMLHLSPIFVGRSVKRMFKKP
jgi:hypothetical protein